MAHQPLPVTEETMSKAKVTSIAAARQAEPRTIPLSDITITWPPLTWTSLDCSERYRIEPAEGAS